MGRHGVLRARCWSGRSRAASSGRSTSSLPFLARAAMLALTFVLAAVFMRETREAAPAAHARARSRERSREVARAGVAYVHHPVVRPLLFASAVQGLFFMFGFYSWQRYFLDVLGPGGGVARRASSRRCTRCPSIVGQRARRPGDQRRGRRRRRRCSRGSRSAQAVLTAVIGALGLLLPASRARRRAVRGRRRRCTSLAACCSASSGRYARRSSTRTSGPSSAPRCSRSTCSSTTPARPSVRPGSATCRRRVSIPLAWLVSGIVLTLGYPLYRAALRPPRRRDGDADDDDGAAATAPR